MTTKISNSNRQLVSLFLLFLCIAFNTLSLKGADDPCNTFLECTADDEAGSAAAAATEYLVGDWNGDGKTTMAFRDHHAVFIDIDGNGSTDRTYTYEHEGAATEYLVGDWDGDGTDNIAVRRGNVIFMYFEDNVVHFNNRTQTYGRGNAESEYLVGDWNGDGTDNIAVRRGNVILMDNDFDGAHDKRQVYGRVNAVDEYLVGDWDGNGTDNIAVRVGNVVLMDYNFDGGHDKRQVYGTGGSEDGYLVGDWDGNGTDNLAVRRGGQIIMDTNFDGARDITINVSHKPSRTMPFGMVITTVTCRETTDLRSDDDEIYFVIRPNNSTTFNYPRSARYKVIGEGEVWRPNARIPKISDRIIIELKEADNSNADDVIGVKEIWVPNLKSGSNKFTFEGSNGSYEVIIYKDNLGYMVDNRDREEYRTVTVDGKIWMAENLRYNNGRESVCRENDCEDGRYYSLKSVKTACPADWRVPTGYDFATLMPDFIDPYSALIAGGSTGFNAQLFGFYNPANNSFGDVSRKGFYWILRSAWASGRRGFVKQFVKNEEGGTIPIVEYYQGNYRYQCRCVKDVSESNN